VPRRAAVPRADGILLVNLGTPAAPTPEAVRSYLAEFLADRRVVELPPLLWRPILHGLVLRLRPARSARKYAAVWTAQGSPLAMHTAHQTEALAARLAPSGLRVAHAMRYGTPRIADMVAQLAAQDCATLRVIPMYPQYARSTTQSVRDVLETLRRDGRTRVPALEMVEDFHVHPAYIAALAAGVRRHWAEHGPGEMLVMSFHGLPKRAVRRGDPYERQCRATAQRLAQTLELDAGRTRVTFQSRFGPAQWLEPYTEPTLEALARDGLRRVDVVTPGFVADCLETLEEIGLGARQAFLDSGGREFHLLPCLNESPEWIEALAKIALEHPARPV
jgi:protoporphyrin/coproporphyrin ferrochelatase